MESRSIGAAVYGLCLGYSGSEDDCTPEGIEDRAEYSIISVFGRTNLFEKSTFDCIFR
jgi:hypothetical protein